MLQSSPNVWYNIDELYTISNQGTIELNTMDNKDRMSATTSSGSYQRNIYSNKATAQQNSPGSTKISGTQKIINSSKIHFLRHILDTERTMTERLIWSTIIIIIAMLAIIIGVCALRSFAKPVLSESYVPVSEIFFPAVTVCPQNKIYNQTTRQNSRIPNFNLEDANKFEESELRKMLCDTPQDMDETMSPTQKRTSRSFDESWMTRALLRFSPQLNKFMHSCKFGNEDCFDEFGKTITEEGLCFTFNGFNLRDLFNHDLILPIQEDTVPSDDGEKPFRYMTAGANLPLVTSSLTRTSKSDLPLTSNPRRAASHLQYLTLDLFTINEYAEDSCRADAGFKIFIHDPETPAHTSTAAGVYEVAMDNEMTVTIAPTQHSTDAVAAGTDAYRCHEWRNRHSMMTNAANHHSMMTNAPNHHSMMTNAPNASMDQLERQELRRFKLYSKTNCQYDVIAQFMEQCAGCVPFYLPRKMDSVICNSTSRLILKQCKEELSSSDITKHCIPGCQNVAYSISTSQKYYRWTVEHKFRKYTAMSRVIVRFNDQYAVSKRWTEESLMGKTCALVLFVLVVVLSVFFGISVISLAELIYCLFAILCRKDKPQPNIPLTKTDPIVAEDPIAELELDKITEESPTFSDDLRTFRGRDGF
ncbi:uncharacterized protein LOC111056495 [Nilaparvata lugens]|uniref:uncharacterized protein LOC111056495 n=1 Tax=Nilaparvata lugens TaxID=108931 RepID=UPI00193D9FA8|nr:uncharacterized protein LOC111056495 [Nilaparvata lugens]